jgi:tryptophan synthase alpha chain
LREFGQKAFIPFTILGWPDTKKSLALIEQMIKSGASALELGISFSDPIADGPIIQSATNETLASGFSVIDAFKLISEVRKIDEDIPIGIMVYFNTVLAHGIEKFFALAKDSGVDGILIADLPAENAEEIIPAGKATSIDLIFIVSPVTKSDRLDKIIAHAQGFLYLVSRLGVTGTTERSSSKDLELSKLIDEIKTKTDLPICAGFGISSVADAQSMLAIGADGVITGSRVIKIVQSTEFDETITQLDRFYSDMIAACSSFSNASSTHKTLV